MRFPPRTALIALGALAIMSAIQAAELPFARLNTIFPPGGQAGTSVELVVAGTDLDDATAIFFNEPGFSSKIKPGSSDIDPDRFILSIGKDVQPGIYEARVLTRFGASNPRRFVVGQLPEILEKADEVNSAAGQKVPLGTTINGWTRPNAVSQFHFSAQKGDRVLVEVAARSIDSRMEPSLILYDNRNREVGRERKTGLLDHVVEEDGELLLKLSDMLYKGGEIYYYRLTISTRPHLDFILPRAAAPGSKSKFTLYGRNLPGGEPAPEFSTSRCALQKLEVEIEAPEKPRSHPSLSHPTGVTVEGFEYRFSGTNGVSNPIFIGLTKDPIILEKGAAEAKVSAPVEFQGQFFPGGDQDWFSFKAAKDSVLWLDVIAQRLGNPVSPFALVQKVTRAKDGSEKLSDVKEVYAADTNLGGPEFNTTSRDLAWRFEVKDEGEYRVGVKDLFHPIAADASLGYRVVLRNETPDFALLVTPQPPPLVNKDKKEATLWTPIIRPGETIPLRVLAFRKDNFNEAIELQVENLPTGLSCAPASIESGANVGFLLIQASTNAPAWTGALRISGRGKVKDQWITREARAGSLAWQVEDYTREAPMPKAMADLVLSVVKTEPAPVSVSLAEAKEWKTNANAKIQVPLRIARQEGFQNALKLKPAWNTAEGKETDLDAKTTNTVLEVDLAPLKLTTGTHYIRFLGSTSGKYRKYTGPDAKALEEKLAAANQEVEKANKQKAEFTEAKKKADASLAAAKKSLAEAKDQAQAEAKAAVQAAETALKDTEAKLKAADDAASAGARRVKQLTDKKNQAKDITYTAYAGPIKVTVEGK